MKKQSFFAFSQQYFWGYKKCQPIIDQFVYYQ